MLKAKLSAYKINACGLYKSENKNVLMASPEELFADLDEWVNQNGMTVATTKTFEDDTAAYTYNVSKSSAGDYLITLWNESPTIDGKAISVNGNEAVGNPTIETTEISPGGILGYPTYFYVIPDKNLFFTVQVNLPQLGINNFGKYIKGFLDRFSRWAVLEEENNRLNSMILGYRENETDEVEHYYARFTASPLRKATELSSLRGRVNEITKIVKKEEFKVQNVHSASLVRAMLKSFGITNQGMENESVYTMEMNFNPTLSELNGIIEKWGTDEYNHWKDVGFKFKGDAKTLWLRNMLAKVEIDIDVRLLQENGVLKSSQLLQVLALNKNHLLGSVGEQ